MDDNRVKNTDKVVCRFCNDVVNFKVPQQKKCIIKVIGVGGGGGNAVSHMYNQGFHDVSFAVCNTDKQALENSPVPYRLQLGREGLGAGNIPAKAAEAAEESIEEIRKMLDDGTRMAFITAGMGGGTGTGAAPIIAREAKAMGILTVGIVTIPFLFEKRPKILQALNGLEKMAENVDALLVINNERLRNVYIGKTVREAFAKSDDVLSNAAQSISDIITFTGVINMDFNDVNTVLKDGGVAIMSTDYGEGEQRVKEAISKALASPLLNNNDIYHSKKVLFNVTCSMEDADGELRMDEMDEIDEFMNGFGDDVEFKYGLTSDASLGGKVKVTILATGFKIKDVNVDMDSPAEIERRKDNDRRIEETYGKQSAARTKRDYFIYLLTPETLDDDEIISTLDVKATYARKYDVIKSIENRVQQLYTPLHAAQEDAPTEAITSIEFGEEA